MRRFFFRPEERVADRVVLSAAESHHIRRVLRLKIGMKVELFDGFGSIHQAELEQIGERVQVRIFSSSFDCEDTPIPLWVCQGLLKAKNMDTVVQKCTELGVVGLIPFLSNRCQGRPDVTTERKKHQRWLKIVEESCKQCRRTRPMELLGTMNFQEVTDFFDSETPGLNILFWEEEQEISLHDLLPLRNIGGVRILLGPEGGLTRQEAAIAQRAGWRTVSLGKHILRAETATLASVAILQHLLGAI